MAATMRVRSLFSKLRIFCSPQLRFGSSLYNPIMLGIPNFQKRRLEIKDQIGDFREKFLTRMADEAAKDQKIFSCDLSTLIELAETDEHINLAVKLMQRYQESMKHMPFQGYFHFGPMLLRLLYIHNKVDEAYSLFSRQNGPVMGRSSVNPLFRKIICFQIIMDMLYKAERYEDIIDLYPISLECFPASSQNIITAVFAALYQMNTEKSLHHLMFLMNNIEMKKLTISSRTFAFAAMLALNQKKPDTALEIIFSPASRSLSENQIRPMNFKLLAFIQLGRLEEVIKILEHLSRQTYMEGCLILFSETIGELETAISKKDNLDMKHNFLLLKRALYRAGLVYPQKFHEYVTAPIYDSRLRASWKKTRFNNLTESRKSREAAREGAY